MLYYRCPQEGHSEVPIMKESIKERKQKLYDATTRARIHFLATERMVSKKVKLANPDMPWYDQYKLVRSNPEWIEANAKLMGLCEACNLIGIECGE